MPEPFLGDRQAPLVVLNRNPEIGEQDPVVHRENRAYVAALRANLATDPAGHRLVGLLPEATVPSVYKLWYDLSSSRSHGAVAATRWNGA